MKIWIGKPETPSNPLDSILCSIDVTCREHTKIYNVNIFTLPRCIWLKPLLIYVYNPLKTLSAKVADDVNSS